MSESVMNSVRPETLEALASAARPEPTTPAAPMPVRITLADKAAGRGPELAEQARREGRPIEVERYESAAGRGIREFAEGSTRDQAIAAGRASVGGFRK